jgi:hypothetical protein
MGSTFSVIKVNASHPHVLRQRRARVCAVLTRSSQTLIIPAVISLILFLVSSYLLVPLWRQYRNRYSQYLPLDTLSNRTSSLRSRVQDAMARFILPSQWRTRLHDRLDMAGDTASDLGFDSDDGEELDEVDEDRRHALSLDTTGRGRETDSLRRLSRE